MLRLPVDATLAEPDDASVSDADGIDDEVMESADVELPAFLTEGVDAEETSTDLAEGGDAHLEAAE
ncbi:hypothetical protein [Rhizobium sp. TH2]|uniref:hypothetical protein n=1 Tax=Rhizobium sp. TH2 TaxID=2775403 RepID=UPI002158670B|nr:hypothetical protein [Rhizobium sp. TH2]